MLDSLLQSVNTPTPQLDLIGAAAYSLFREDARKFVNNEGMFSKLLQILFVCRDESSIRRVLNCRFPKVLFDVRFVEGQDLATSVLIGNGTEEFSIFFGAFTSTPFLAIILDRWLPTVAIFEHNAQHHPFTGRLTMNFHDQGYGGGLSFCDNQNFDYLIPDPGYLTTRGYEMMKVHYDKNGLPWEDREDRLLWRGSTTGTRTGDVMELPRVKLCQLSLLPGFCDEIDARITACVQLDELDEQSVKSSGVIGDYISNGDYGKYKYHVDIDGNTNAWSGLICKLLTGGVVFKVDSPYGFRQWYYDYLEPWKHFVPVQSDLSDLVHNLRMIRSDPKRAIAIANAGRDLIKAMSLEDEIAKVSAKLDRLAHKDILVTGDVQSVFISQDGDPTSSSVANAVKSAFDRASIGDSGLSERILRMNGLSGRKLRHFTNNIVRSMKNSRYLEIGSWCGATACAALEGNKTSVTCIDDWSTNDGAEAIFNANIKRTDTSLALLSVLGVRFQEADFSKLGLYNIFSYHGPTEPIEMRRAIDAFSSCSDKSFVLIVSNWNWLHVRLSTEAALEENGLCIKYKVDVRTTLDDTHPDINRERSNWHNGCLLASIDKCS